MVGLRATIKERKVELELLKKLNRLGIYIYPMGLDEVTGLNCIKER